MFKKTKKSHKPSQQLLALGVPTQIAVGTLGLNADLDLDTDPEGVFRRCNRATDLADLTTSKGADNGGGSRIVFQEGSGAQQPHASGVSNPAHEGMDDVTLGGIRR